MNQDPSEKWPVLEPKQEIYKVSPKYLTVPKSNEKKNNKRNQIIMGGKVYLKDTSIN